MSFETWLLKVDEQLIALCDMDSWELPDWDYWVAWNAGQSPSEAAAAAFASAGGFIILTAHLITHGGLDDSEA